MDDAVLAIDIGGTKLEVGLVDETGRVLDRRRAPTGARPWEALRDLVAGVTDAAAGAGTHRPIVCGVGAGGPMTPGGEEVSPLNIVAWRSFPLRRRLVELTGLAVYIDNDAKALALAEGWLGAARGERDFLAMVVSTGVGGGIVVDGRLVDGHSSNAGHVGHIVVVPDGRPCVCGARGCLEAEASGPSVAATTGRPAAEAPPEVVARVGTLVGQAASTMCVTLDLRLVTVAGSVALGWGDPFFVAAQAALDAGCRISYSRGARIVAAGLGADGPLVGAAAVGLRGLGRDPLAPARP